MSTYQNIQSAAFWLDKNKSNIHREGKTQILHLLQTLIEQNYFQRDINPYPTAFPYGNGKVLHFYQQQESSTTKTVHKVINKGLKTYV
jgi:hypothetical protein